MKKFAGKMILTDLDGTFFGAKSKIIPRNIEAIKYFTSEGGLFSIATGRMHLSLAHHIPMVNNIVNAPVIVCNGAYMFDFKNEKPLCECFLDKTTARRAVDFMFKSLPTVGIRLSVPEGYMTLPNPSPTMQSDMNTCPPERQFYLPLDEWMNYGWYKIVIRDKADALDRLKEALIDELGDVFECGKSQPTFLEIQKKGCTKASMLPKLKKMFSTAEKPLKVYAVGDYSNDYDMIKAADVGVCPSNALQQIKDIADICLCSNEEGVIADLVESIEKGIV